MTGLPFLYAYLLGMATLISPCCLIVIPTVLAHSRGRPHILLRFILGFSISVLALAISAIMLGTLWSATNGFWMYMAGGIITGLAGFAMIGIIRFPSFSIQGKQDIRFPFLSGLTMGGVSLTCVGPALAAMFGLALTVTGAWDKAGIALLYVAGSVTPFLFYGLALTRPRVNGFMDRHSPRIQKASAIAMILVSAWMISIGLAGATL